MTLPYAEPVAELGDRLQHRAFYGLAEGSFDLTADPKWFVMTAGHQEALSNLEYGISCGTGITLLLGEPGTGKTSVLQRALTGLTGSSSRAAVRAVQLTNPSLSLRDFLETLAQGFDLSPTAACSKSQMLRELEQKLTESRAAGWTFVLIVDEAQSMPDGLLEEIRLLANMEWRGDKLLRIVLSGQPALGWRLNGPALEQLKQRVGLRCVLAPLALEETAHYIAHRILAAGGTPTLVFSREAVSEIHQRSRGIPRLINVICDNALLNGFAADERPIRRETILSVCADFDLAGPPAGPVALPQTLTRYHQSRKAGPLSFSALFTRRR